MSIQMPGGAAAQLFLRLAGKMYRPLDRACPHAALISGRIEADGRQLVVRGEGATTFVFVEARTIAIPMRDGDTAAYTEGDTSVHYRGAFYHGNDDTIFAAETSSGRIDAERPTVLVISTSASGRWEDVFFERV